MREEKQNTRMVSQKILVPVTGNIDRTTTLDLAVALGRVVPSEVEILYVGADPERLGAAGYNGMSVAWIYDHREVLPQLLSVRADAARAAFRGWARRNRIGLIPEVSPAQDVSVRWMECVGVPEEAIADFGRFCDLIVLSLSDSADNERDMVLLEAALFEAARPVLLAPRDASKPLRQDVIVGWDASPGAFRALRGALPLLSRMQRVVLLTVGGSEPAGSVRDNELLGYLASHGVQSERMTLQSDRRPVGARLLHEAALMDAGLVVIGAYSHSPWHEAFFGSTTREVVQMADRPVFLAH